jgi:hypothetical protein
MEMAFIKVGDIFLSLLTAQHNTMNNILPFSPFSLSIALPVIYYVQGTSIVTLVSLILWESQALITVPRLIDTYKLTCNVLFP